MTGARQTQRYPEPERPPGFACGRHPQHHVEWDYDDLAWLCTKCGMDVEDTMTKSDTIDDSLRPWYFGAKPAIADDTWVKMPVPVAAKCTDTDHCGRRFEEGDAGLYLFDPESNERHPFHALCVWRLLELLNPQEAV